MIQDRKDYQKQYYQANKERLRLKRMGKDGVGSIGLFDGQSESKFVDQKSLFEKPVENIEELRSQQIKSIVDSTSQVKKLSSNVEIESVENSNRYLSTAILIFLVANTVFLVHEQTVFFLMKKYSLTQAIYFSVLMESALLLLSFLASYVRNKIMKLCYYVLLVLSIVVSSLIVCSSVEKRDQQEVQASERIQSLKKQIKALERQEAIALANIEALDPEKYPSKRGRLVDSLQAGVAKELAKKREILNSAEVGGLIEGETTVMKWMRLLAIAWNVIFAHFRQYY